MDKPDMDTGRAHNRIAQLAVLVVLTLLLAVLDLASGSVRIPFGEVVRALLGTASQQEWGVIIGIFRLPKLVTAMLAGAGLAAAGLMLQSLFRNPLAGPDSLGIGAGASIGVALLMFAGNILGLQKAAGTAGSALLGGLQPLGYVALVLAASLGSFAVLLMILLLARKFEQVVTVLIMGLLVGYLASSVVSLLIYFGSPQKAQVYLAWTYGSFGGVRAGELPFLSGAVLLGCALAAFDRKALNAFLLGERFAATIGIRVRSSRTRLLIAAALLAGSVTAFCGPIAFLGIAAPQAARRLARSSEHGVLLPVSMLLGMIFALSADILSSLPGKGAVLPVNPLLALIGSPVILSMFLRGAREDFEGGV
ncbi:MAG: iron ABC transporter permease [Spirochaetales bacterium]|nr:iron ABC transporter permease [Spirochaetales bacterium]